MRGSRTPPAFQHDSAYLKGLGFRVSVCLGFRVSVCLGFWGLGFRM